jgi:serine/threonine protein kinase
VARARKRNQEVVVDTSQPTGPLASEPPTRRVSGTQASAPTRPLSPGDRDDAQSGGSGGLVLGRYRLEERLGAGGFGVVWRARDEHLEREVAVKAIARADTASGEQPDDRPAREARAAARLNHPGIVALYEMGADAKTVYLVSELVHGRTFAELGRGGALSDRDVGRIGVALAEALAHAHARGVIHRDVKPQNVLVLAEPAAGAGFAKLADFGVAHLVGDEPLTRTGDIVGTLAYMAPEQAEGLPPTGACDVYSLALTLYEGFAGENPMRGRSPAETARLVGGYVPPLREFRRDLPISLCRGLDACLDPRPEHRPDLAELRDWVDESVDRLESRGGLVDPGTLARFGLLRRGERREEPLPPPARGREEPFGGPAERREQALPPREYEPGPRREPEPRRAYPFPGAPEPRPVRRPRMALGGTTFGRLIARVAAGLAAGGLVLAALGVGSVEAPVAPVPAAAAVAAAVALLPRIAWLLAATAAIAWIALGAGLDGAAALIVLPVLATPLLLPRAGTAWSVPALAPLLGTIAIAPAFVAVAGLARTPARRAGLGAAGYLWLAGAEALTGDPLLFGAPPAVPGPAAWEGSLPTALTEAVLPFLSTPALLPALAWGLFAALLPLAVRGRSLKLDLVRGLVWAAGLIAVLLTLGDLLASGGAGLDTRGAELGPLVGLALAVGVTTLRSGARESPRDRGDWPPADAMGRPIVA